MDDRDKRRADGLGDGSSGKRTRSDVAIGAFVAALDGADEDDTENDL